MTYFLVTFHETDGNDVTVFDSVVGAEDKDAAFGKVADEIERRLRKDGRAYSEDGDCGFYFDCAEDCVEDCEGHGGIVMRDAEPFETREDADKAQSAIFYHSRFTTPETEDRDPLCCDYKDCAHGCTEDDLCSACCGRGDCGSGVQR